MATDSRVQRILLAGDEPAAGRIRRALDGEYTLESDPSADADVRIVGPRLLEAEGPRVLRQLRQQMPGVPAVVVLGDDPAPALVRDCFREGAVDVLELREIEAGLPSAIAAAARQARRAQSRESQVQSMASELACRARDLERALGSVREAYEQTLIALVAALDQRERETACHSQRVAGYAVYVGLRLGLENGPLEDLYRGALLHDIGKIGIPDAVLLKPGELSPQEWETMRSHAELGAALVRQISFLEGASDVPAAHHEAWDGSGYPRGLRRAEIPLHARIFAIVDSYDAIRSERPYKPAASHDRAVSALLESAGSRLDPELVALFAAQPAEVWERIAGAAERHATYPAVLRVCTEAAGR
jgi:putative nucleotidyltransferase with HDIG domain